MLGGGLVWRLGNRTNRWGIVMHVPLVSAGLAPQRHDNAWLAGDDLGDASNADAGKALWTRAPSGHWHWAGISNTSATT
jgi:hypothetical protein